jgi:hypothetical protein
VGLVVHRATAGVQGAIADGLWSDCPEDTNAVAVARTYSSPVSVAGMAPADYLAGRVSAAEEI